MLRAYRTLAWGGADEAVSPAATDRQGASPKRAPSNPHFVRPSAFAGRRLSHGLLRTLIAFQMLRNVEKRRFEAIPSPSNVGVSRAQNINYGNFLGGIDLRKSN